MNYKSYLEGFLQDVRVVIPNKSYDGKYKGKEAFAKIYESKEARDEAIERNEIFKEITPEIFHVDKGIPLIIFRRYRPIVSSDGELRFPPERYGANFIRTLDDVVSKIHRLGYGHGNLSLKHIVVNAAGTNPLITNFDDIYSLENHTWQTELIMRDKRWKGRFYEYVLRDYYQWRDELKELITSEISPPPSLIPTKPNEEYYQERYTRDEYLFGDEALEEAKQRKGTLYGVYENDKIIHYLSKINGNYVDSTGVYTNELSLFKVLSLRRGDASYKLGAFFDDEVKRMLKRELYEDEDQSINRMMNEYPYTPYVDLETPIGKELKIFDLASLLRISNLEAAFLMMNETEKVPEIILQVELPKATWMDVSKEFSRITNNFPKATNDFSRLVLSPNTVPIARLCLKYNSELFADLLAYCVCIPERTYVDDDDNLITLNISNLQEDDIGSKQVEEGMVWWLDIFDGISLKETEEMFGRLYDIAWDLHYTYITILFRIFMYSKTKPYDILELLIRESSVYRYFDLLYNYLIAAKEEEIGEQYKEILDKYLHLQPLTDYIFKYETTNNFSEETLENFFSTALYPSTLMSGFPNLVGDRDRLSIHYLRRKEEVNDYKEVALYYTEKFDTKYSLSLLNYDYGRWHKDFFPLFLKKGADNLDLKKVCNFLAVYVNNLNPSHRELMILNLDKEDPYAKALIKSL